MRAITSGMVLSFMLVWSHLQAEEVRLFNGKDVADWKFELGDAKSGDKKLTKDDFWLVQDGILISRGGFAHRVLEHPTVFTSDFVFSLQWRWPPNVASGGGVMLHLGEEHEDSWRRQGIRVGLDVDEAGGIEYKGMPAGVNAQRARQTSEEVEKDMGQWNLLQVICHGKVMTVVVNGRPVNQVLDAPRTEGKIGLQFSGTPLLFREIKVEKPLRPDHLRMEQAAKPLAAAWAKAEALRMQKELRKQQERLTRERAEEAKKAQIAKQRDSLIDKLRAAAAADRKQNVAETEIALHAKALPYPKDAREIEFRATFGMIEFKSGSSLNALAAFYMRELAKRGWSELPDEASMDDESIELVFESGEAEFELDLDQSSDYVTVRIDTDGVAFDGMNDPAALVKLGIPQPRKAVLLQREVAIPENVQRLEFDSDGCMFFSTMKLEEAFAHFGKLIREKGYRESRRPIISKTRNYTEFQRGGVELSVNIFTDEVGSRIILEYDDGKKDPVLPPLEEITLDGKALSSPAEASQVTAESRPVDVSNNQGSASITLGKETYSFQHVAAFRSKSSIENLVDETSIVFSKHPIPFAKLQQHLATEDHIFFADLGSEIPNYLIVDVGDYPSFSCSLPGTGISQGIKQLIDETRIEQGRVRGTLKLPAIDVFDRELSFTVSVDAAIMTPDTRVKGAPAPAPSTVDGGEFVDTYPPAPDDADSFSRTGSNYSKTYETTSRGSLETTTEFYQSTLARQGWKQVEIKPNAATANDKMLRFRGPQGDLTIRLVPQGTATRIAITKRDESKARQDGVLPESGKGRLILANAHRVGVAFTIGNTDYPLRAGQGSKDFKTALNYSVGPGKYTIIIKIPGQRPKTEVVNISAGSTWAIIALPTGGHLPTQLY